MGANAEIGRHFFGGLANAEIGRHFFGGLANAKIGRHFFGGLTNTEISQHTQRGLANTEIGKWRRMYFAWRLRRILVLLNVLPKNTAIRRQDGAESPICATDGA